MAKRTKVAFGSTMKPEEFVNLRGSLTKDSPAAAGRYTQSPDSALPGKRTISLNNTLPNESQGDESPKRAPGIAGSAMSKLSGLGGGTTPIMNSNFTSSGKYQKDDVLAMI